jgi:CTP:molybdopterin cytidylyltransferase MocA
MGTPKAMLPLRGRPLVLWHIERLAEVATQVVVVAGAHHDEIASAIGASARVIENPAWETTWPADSLALALRSVAPQGSCWVTPVDTPPARIQTLQALLCAAPPCVPVDAHGRPGHPVLIGRQTAAAIQRLPPPGGLRSLLQTAERVPVDDPLVATAFNDPIAWRTFTTSWRDG